MSGPPVHEKAENIRKAIESLDAGVYSFTDLARAAFEIAEGKRPSGHKRDDAKKAFLALAVDNPERFRITSVSAEVLS